MIETKRGVSILRQRIRNFGSTVKILDACSLDHDDCKNCSDLTECTSLYDDRCGIWENKLNLASILKGQRR